MATVTNWIDHLSASEVKGAIYPGVGSEGILVILGLIIWIGWHVITAKQEKEELENLQGKDVVQMIGKAILPTGN